MCVSTAIVSWLKTVFKTTLAVFPPTPGSDSRASRELGTSASWWSTSNWHVFIIFLAFVLNKQMVLMYFLSPFSPKLRIS